MKIATLVCSVFALALLCTSSSVKAQCGCSMGAMSGPSYPAMSYPAMSYPAMSYPAMSYPAMSAPSYQAHSNYQPLPAPAMRNGVPANIAYVNRLAAPVPRANYSLNYAIHLTDGRILLSDFLPAGQSIRGVESQNGAGGRRLNTAYQAPGIVAVTDPASNQTVTTFPGK